jgi:hypothetical protein
MIGNRQDSAWSFTMSRVLAILALISTVAMIPQADAADLLTPPGLNPGDQFRFIFVTKEFAADFYDDIAVYNEFVNTEAGGATYDSSTITWYAVASTTNTNAQDNIGDFGSNIPVYLPTGTQVASNLSTGAGGLWSGTLMNPVNLDIDEKLVNGSVWTGSAADGTIQPGAGIGTSSPAYGNSSSTDSTWLFAGTENVGTGMHFYAISQTLTVVPEPSSIVLGLLATFCTIGIGLRSKRYPIAIAPAA